MERTSSRQQLRRNSTHKTLVVHTFCQLPGRGKRRLQSLLDYRLACHAGFIWASGLLHAQAALIRTGRCGSAWRQGA